MIPPSGLPKRILIVDNDPGTRKAVKEVFELRYEVHTAEGSREELLSDARRLLARHSFHLAILDLRLWNDNDPEDWSGFDLASEIARDYPWVSCMFLTGYGNFDVAKRALEQQIVQSITLKEKGVKELVATVDELFAHRIKCAWDQEKKWQGKQDWLAARRSLSDLDWGESSVDEFLDSEFHEALARLFPEATHLHLRRIGDAPSSLSVKLGNSLLLRVTPRLGTEWLQEVVVKIGRREAVRREIDSYDRYVKNRMAGYRYADQKAHALTAHLGGIVYALIDTDMDHWSTFKDYYQKPETTGADVNAVLDRLFDHLLSSWYSNATTEHYNLWQEYGQALDLERRLRALDWGDEPTLRFPGLSRPLPNPLPWLARYSDNSDMLASQHIIHGDLHSRNIFVGDDQGVWLIDFERTGPGHAVRDFVELETDIKFGLTELDSAELPLFFKLECALLSHSRDQWWHGAVRAPESVRRDPRMRRAFSAIAELRRLAANQSRYPDFRDYYWGLLLHTLAMATLGPISKQARSRCKLSAALICDRLGDGQHVPNSWPPRTRLAPRRKGPVRPRRHRKNPGAAEK